jgi:hypothetical protein
MGEWRYSSITHDLSTRYGWVVILMPRPLYPRGKKPQYPLNRGLGGPHSRSGPCGVEKNLLPLPGIEPQPSSSARRYPDSSSACSLQVQLPHRTNYGKVGAGKGSDRFTLGRNIPSNPTRSKIDLYALLHSRMFDEFVGTIYGKTIAFFTRCYPVKLNDRLRLHI